MSLRDEVRALLARHELSARRAFGQNFLVDAGVLRDIAGAALRAAPDHVVEIGPGLGTLTRFLAEDGVPVTAVEKDARLVPVLRELFEAQPHVEIVQADALEVDLAGLGAGQRRSVAGNIPYNISSPLLFALIGQRAALADSTLMVQREVAERWMAPPGGKAYGSPSVMLRVYADVERVRGVPPQCFLPAPRVHSTVIRIRWLEAPRVSVGDPAHFERVVRAAFSRRRKMLRNALTSTFSKEAVEAAASAVALERRAETLDVHEFAALAAALSRS